MSECIDVGIVRGAKLIEISSRRSLCRCDPIAVASRRVLILMESEHRADQHQEVCPLPTADVAYRRSLNEFQTAADRFSGLKSNPVAWLRNKMEGWNADDYFFGDKLDLPPTSAASRQRPPVAAANNAHCRLPNHCSIGCILCIIVLYVCTYVGMCVQSVSAVITAVAALLRKRLEVWRHQISSR